MGYSTKIALTRNSGGGSTPTENNSFIVTETNHGYVTTDLPLAMFHTVTGWELARADNSSTLATHIMVAITDVNHYTLAQVGRFQIANHGLILNNYYFLSSTVSGKFTDIEPDVYSNPLLFIESVNYIHVLPFRPSVTNDDTIITVNSFLDLNDTPDSYVGQEDKYVRVNDAGTGLEFVTISSLGTSGHDVLVDAGSFIDLGTQAVIIDAGSFV